MVSGRCLGGIWGLSEWLLILSGGYNVQTPISLIFTSWFLFCQLPQIIQNGPYFGVSGGCLEGVLEVSGDYLSDPGYCLEGYVVGSIEKKIILGHFNQLRHFLTVANFRRFRAQNAKFQVWFYIWRSPQIKKNPIETGLKIKFPVRIQMDQSYNWDRTSQRTLMYSAHPQIPFLCPFDEKTWFAYCYYWMHAH